MKCPCQSTLSYSDCCQPLHLQKALATNALQLMRSRFCAYALNIPQYIYDTYHSNKQADLNINELAQWAEQTTWLKLEIAKSTDSSVTFIATYAEDGHLYQIKEHSRFEIEGLAVKYTDGDILFHERLAKPKRNEPCPCGSGKKLKQCCGVKSQLI